MTDSAIKVKDRVKDIDNNMLPGLYAARDTKQAEVEALSAALETARNTLAAILVTIEYITDSMDLSGQRGDPIDKKDYATLSYQDAVQQLLKDNPQQWFTSKSAASMLEKCGKQSESGDYARFVYTMLNRAIERGYATKKTKGHSVEFRYKSSGGEGE